MPGAPPIAERGTGASATSSGWPQSGQSAATPPRGAECAHAEQCRVQAEAVTGSRDSEEVEFAPGSGLLAGHERADALDRIEVLGQHLVVLDGDAERVLEKADHLEHARRIDDAQVEQRGVVGQRLRLGDRKTLYSEVAHLFREFHPASLCVDLTRGSLATQREP